MNIIEKTQDGAFVLRAPDQIGSRPWLLLAQAGATLVFIACIALAGLLSIGALLQIGAPRLYMVAWISYVALALLAAYGCRKFVSYLRRARGGF